jgi:hypothetical protein
MSDDPEYQELRRERLESYKKVWRVFLWLGWPAALLTLWLGSRIIDGLHARIVVLSDDIRELHPTRKAP